jgi:hypothetical protein
MTMRQKIESMTLFDSDILRLTAEQSHNGTTTGSAYDDEIMDQEYQESRESLKRSSQQSISAAVLVSLAHKRYERRRLAAMEIEKVVRSLVVLHQQKNHSKAELERIRAILLLLSDDYVRSTSEDARKGGVVALAACAIGLKKADDRDPIIAECRDLILASVVHACQDHSQRVRYYATESLFNVVKGTYVHTYEYFWEFQYQPTNQPIFLHHENNSPETHSHFCVFVPLSFINSDTFLGRTALFHSF